MKTTTTPRGMTGPRTTYRNKVDTPLSVKLTAVAIGILDKDCSHGGKRGRTGLRKSDYIEALIRNYGHLIPASTETSPPP